MDGMAEVCKQNCKQKLVKFGFPRVFLALINQVRSLAGANVTAENLGKLTRAVEAVEAAGMRNGSNGTSNAGNETTNIDSFCALFSYQQFLTASSFRGPKYLFLLNF